MSDKVTGVHCKTGHWRTRSQVCRTMHDWKVTDGKWMKDCKMTDWTLKDETWRTDNDWEDRRIPVKSKSTHDYVGWPNQKICTCMLNYNYFHQFWSCNWQSSYLGICHFYPNVTTCLSSVTLVHPTQEVEPFGNISPLLCTLAILWPSCKILRRSSQGNPSAGSAKRKRGIKIHRFWTYRRLYLINGAT